MGTMTRLAVALSVFAMASLIGAPNASAQRSNFGTITLDPGFMPDPHVAQGTSGGAADASNVNSQCRGWISSNPDHILRVVNDFSFLRIFAQSDADTTLVIQTPNGQVRCNDDTYGLNPSVEGRFPQGTYRIWVGSYEQGTNSRYQLKLSELRSTTPDSSSNNNSNNNNANVNRPSDADRGLQPDARRGNFDPVTLRTGFTPDPARKTGVSGGVLNATRLGGDCRGWIAGRPDHIMNLRTNFNFFRVFVTSESDTTLVIRLPNGRFICNDDTNGLNPALERNRWRRGMYRVWVGSYSEGDNARYNIGFTELQNVTE